MVDKHKIINTLKNKKIIKINLILKEKGVDIIIFKNITLKNIKMNKNNLYEYKIKILKVKVFKHIIMLIFSLS